MKIEPFDVLKRAVSDRKLGLIAEEAIRFVGDDHYQARRSSGSGQSSVSIVRMYKVRMGLVNFRASAFVGLDETIETLGQQEVTVHLSVIETERGVISLWLADPLGPPLGIVIAKFLAEPGDDFNPVG
jgi:hypothetical protein